MQITDEFIERLKEQRNLQSCITNLGILAQCIRELQANMDEAMKRLGMPDKADEKE